MLRSLIIICVALALSPLSATAQQREAPPSSGSMSGLVVDAATTLPLAGAKVVLEPRTMGAFPVRPAGASAFVQATRATTTDSAGRYRFKGVPKGEYSLHVQRLGYRSTTLAVELRGPTDSRVSIGLDVEAVALHPLEVSAQGPTTTPLANSYGRTVPADGRGDARLAAERLRQRQHLSSDVRSITHADVEEGVTLAETDLFRALQRLPGVSTRDDYSAELWTRGAPWDQTRVLFDRLPLFNPVHALGIFSGVNSDAIGAASMHPGVQPASLPAGAAGTLDLRSRRGGGSGKAGLHGLGELSLASARLALDREFADGRGAWMLAGRRTYLELVAAAISAAANDEDFIPYAFSDVVGRFDYQLGADRRVEVSGIREWDHLYGDLPDVVHGNTMFWGNTAGRATLDAPLWTGRARHTVGVSRYASRVRQHPSANDERYSAFHGPASDNNISVGVIEGEWAPAPGRGTPWLGGYRLEAMRADYTGPMLQASPGRLPVDTLELASKLVVGVLWGERRWRPWAPVTVSTGIRLEFGEAALNAASVRLAPRIDARYQLAPGTALSAGIGRGYQYTQTISAVGVPNSGLYLPLPTERAWLLAGHDAPALRSDIATVGIETWITEGWLASANAYLRRQDGLIVSDPAPGEIVDRPLFAEAEGEAHGFELSARKLTGRWTASASYAYGVSEVLAGDLRFPSSADRRHVVDATTMLRPGRSWRLGAAYTAASGAPYTRTHEGAYQCDEADRCRWATPPRIEQPNALRAPAYQSLDLLLDWNHAFRSWELGAYLQLRNAFNHWNPGPYVGFVGQDCLGCDRKFLYNGGDKFVSGPPILPLFGFRIAF